MTSDHRQLRLRLRQRCAGPEARPNSNAETRFEILHSRFSVLTKRGIHIRLSGEVEACGRDADNGMGLSIKNKRRTDRRRAPAVAALPHIVADDDYGRRAKAVFIA